MFLCYEKLFFVNFAIISIRIPPFPFHHFRKPPERIPQCFVCFNLTMCPFAVEGGLSQSCMGLSCCDVHRSTEPEGAQVFNLAQLTQWPAITVIDLSKLATTQPLRASTVWWNWPSPGSSVTSQRTNHTTLENWKQGDSKNIHIYMCSSRCFSNSVVLCFNFDQWFRILLGTPTMSCGISNTSSRLGEYKCWTELTRLVGTPRHIHFSAAFQHCR